MDSNNCRDQEPADLITAVGSDSLPEFSCDLCPKVSATFLGIQLHRRKAHPDQYMKEAADQLAAKPQHKHGKIEESEIDKLAKVEAMLEFKHIDNRGVQRIGQLL